jgi:glycine betaine/proline transport system permease protein
VTAGTAAVRRPAGIRLSKGRRLALLLAVAAGLFLLFQGTSVQPYDPAAELFKALNGVRNWLDANQDAWFFAWIEPLRLGINGLVDLVTSLLTAVGWLGVVAVTFALGLATVTWRTALVAAGALVLIGALGLWDATMVTLGQVIVAVTIALVAGVSLGIVAGLSDRFLRIVTPILDLMQIMPTFAYLPPLVLFFGIGNATAVIATLIYAIPPAIRLTSLGIRGVASETVEAATSLGSTGRQVLVKVQLPMARTTVGLAVNQTIMMALSMVVITAFVGAGGLGEAVMRGLKTLDVGVSFDAGVAIVLLAMILDRLTASASATTDRRQRGLVRRPRVSRRVVVGSAIAVAVVGLVLGFSVEAANTFPAGVSVSFADPINAGVAWIEKNLVWLTDGLKNVVSAWLLDPIQTFLTTSPWWLVVGIAAGLAAIITGRRAMVVAGAAILGVLLLQVWEPSMETLTQVIVAVGISMTIGIAMGTWAARSDLVSRVLRPINDAAQTMPSFVYLIPAVALFNATRFTAIVAAVVYTVPAVVRLVEDGVRGVSPTAMEAAQSAGSTTFQVIRKVQLPMARRSLLAATNQGIVLVLAMVVVGGLVGGGGLGYQVVAGLAQYTNFGSGMAAALALVALGIMLDRITQGAGARRETSSDE